MWRTVDLRLTNKAVRTKSVRSLLRGLGGAIELSMDGVTDLGGLELLIGKSSMSTGLVGARANGSAIFPEG